MQLYACAVTIWRTDTEVVTIPVVTVERDRESADRYALAVAMRAASESEPALLERPCRVISVAQSDATANAVRDALRVPRGRQAAQGEGK